MEKLRASAELLKIKKDQIVVYLAKKLKVFLKKSVQKLPVKRNVQEQREKLWFLTLKKQKFVTWKMEVLWKLILNVSLMVKTYPELL